MEVTPIKIFVNGDSKEVASDSNIFSFLQSQKISTKHIAIEINESLIFRSNWEETTLKEGDKIEIVKAIGGG